MRQNRIVEPFIYLRSPLLPGLIAVPCAELGIHPDLRFGGEIQREYAKKHNLGENNAKNGK
jgi:hypothetical protein